MTLEVDKPIEYLSRNVYFNKTDKAMARKQPLKRSQVINWSGPKTFAANAICVSKECLVIKKYSEVGMAGNTVIGEGLGVC